MTKRNIDQPQHGGRTATNSSDRMGPAAQGPCIVVGRDGVLLPPPKKVVDTRARLAWKINSDDPVKFLTPPDQVRLLAASATKIGEGRSDPVGYPTLGKFSECSRQPLGTDAGGEGAVVQASTPRRFITLSDMPASDARRRLFSRLSQLITTLIGSCNKGGSK